MNTKEPTDEEIERSKDFIRENPERVAQLTELIAENESKLTEIVLRDFSERELEVINLLRSGRVKLKYNLLKHAPVVDDGGALSVVYRPLEEESTEEELEDVSEEMRLYLKRSWWKVFFQGAFFVLLFFSLVAVVVFSFQLSKGLDASLKSNRTISAESAVIVAPAANQLNTLSRDLDELRKKIETIAPKSSRQEFELVIATLSEGSKRALEIRSDLGSAADSLKMAAGSEFQPVAEEIKVTPAPVRVAVLNSIMDQVGPDANRNPRWYRHRYPNLVELYYQKSDEQVGQELRRALEDKGAFIPPPGKNDPIFTQGTNFIWYYHAQDKQLADNVRDAIVEFFRMKGIPTEIKDPFIPPSFNKMDVQIGQVAAYILNIPDNQ